jgi:hypothetical protein
MRQAAGHAYDGIDIRDATVEPEFTRESAHWVPIVVVRLVIVTLAVVTLAVVTLAVVRLAVVGLAVVRGRPG